MLYDGKPLFLYMTQTERTRFARTLYPLWTLIPLKDDDDENRKREIGTILLRDVNHIQRSGTC